MKGERMKLHELSIVFLETAKEEGMSLRKMQAYLAGSAIEAELVACHGNQSEAARRLGINRLTLRTYLQAYESAKA